MIKFRHGFIILTVAALTATGCGPTMREYKGHVIFNSRYLFYLEASYRDEWQKPEEVLDALKLPTNAIVADIGAGGGYFTEKFAGRVGPGGRVYATDVQDALLKKLRQRVAEHRLENVTVVHAAFDDPTLPEGACDLAFFSSVYKEIGNRADYMRRLAKTLKPSGRVAILEYRMDVRAPGPPPKYRLPEEQVIEEMTRAGFALQERFDFLPREYFLVFGLGP